MASTRGFEPMTARLEGVCSIQLSYVDISLDCSCIIGTLTVAEPLILKNVDYSVIFLSNFLS